MTTELVSLTHSSQTVTLTINRTEALNALNYDVLNALSAHLDRLHASVTAPSGFLDVRVVLLRGAGEKAFVAGADIRSMKEGQSKFLREFTELGLHVMRQIEALPLPVIAVVDGFALGGGMELALSCDLIVTNSKAKFGQPEVNLGIIPGFGGTQRLVKRCGVGTAKRLIFTGDIVGAEEASKLGISDYLWSDSDFEAQLSTLCDTLSARGPLALAAAKRAIEVGVEGIKSTGLAAEKAEFLALFHSADAQEGLCAFLDKRKPQFQGR